MTFFDRFKKWLAEPVDGHVIGAFRLLFGVLMLYNTLSYYQIRLVDNGFIAPKVLFRYDGLEWLPYFPKPVLMTAMALMAVSAIGITLGVAFRWACLVFAFTLSFILLQDKSYYNNHIYLYILMAVLLSFTNADRFLSLRGSDDRPFNAVPRWQPFILQAQIVIVYFYGGLAKINADWFFRKEPIKTLAANLPPGHALASLVKSGFGIDMLVYGGFLLDILAPLLLWYKPLRRWALIPFAAFHLTNSSIFHDIGTFPFVMLATLILFFETRELPFLRALAEPPKPTGKKGKEAVARPVVAATTPLVRNLLIGYFAFQLLFPFRGFFLPNSMDWTGIGKQFAWRMKIDTRPIEKMEFKVQNPANGQSINVDMRSFVNETQVMNMANDPRSVAAFAREVRAEAARKGIPNAIVKGDIQVRYNGRPPQPLVDPEVDLASVHYSPFRKLDWVVPLKD